MSDLHISWDQYHRKTEQLANEVLALPISEHINEDNIKYISDTICKFYQTI